MVSSSLLLFGLASIFLYVTPCVSDINCEQELSNTEKTSTIVLENSKTGLVFCGGTLITNYYVLTAADCVYNRQPDEIHAFSGIKYLCQRYDRCKMRSVDEIIVHESYDPLDLWRNNIALVRLGRLILAHNCTLDPWVSKAIVPQEYKLNKLIRKKLPVKILYEFGKVTKLEPVERKLLIRFSGFGIKSEYQPPAYDELIESFTEIVDWLDCRDMYYDKFKYNITASLICIYDPYKFSHPIKYKYRISDVGGSVTQNVIYGIALNVTEDFYSETNNFPILSTNVSFYYDWIDHVINRYDEDDVEMKIFQTSGCCRLLDCYFLNSITIPYFFLTILVLTQTYA